MPFNVGAALCVVVIVVYNLFFFNRYFPLSEGWFSAYAHLMRGGAVPYRDFYLYVTPLYPTVLAVFTSVFGEAIVWLRVLGIAVMSGIGLLLHSLLRQRFAPLPSFAATVAAIILYQSGVAHIAYDFIQIVTFFSLAATLCLVKYGQLCEGGPVNPAEGWPYPFAAGVFASLAFLTKQSNGAFVVAFSAFALALIIARSSAKTARAAFLVYVAGGLIPAAAVLVWLGAAGALDDFLRQVVSHAISVKGGSGTIFFGWLVGIVTPAYAAQLKIVAIYVVPFAAVSVIGYFVSREWLKVLDWWRQEMLVPAAAVLFLAIVVLPYVRSMPLDHRFMILGQELYKYIVVIATTTYVFLVAAFITVRLLGLKLGGIELFVVGTMGLGLIAGNGTSAGIGEVSTFLGFAIFMAWLISLPRIAGAGAVVAGILCGSLVLWLAALKYERPYAWWSVTQPSVRSAVERPATELLNGLRLSPATNDVLDGAARILSEQARPSEDVLAFPHMPILYLASGRWPSGKAVVHWFDFIADDAADVETERILNAPPKVIAFLEMPELVWILHERLFRGGKPTRLRQFREAIHQLTSKPGAYRLQARYDVPDNCILWIWVKEDNGKEDG
jgi:hypothetical protein